jgi:hypothetical protein
MLVSRVHTCYLAIYWSVMRIEGTPAKSITLGGEGGGAIPFVNVSPAENDRRIAELLAKAGGAGDSDCAD